MHHSDNYQWKLRALGAFLDTQTASHISLIETRNGFATRYYQHRGATEPTFVLVEEPQLRAITEALRQRRVLTTRPGEPELGGPLSSQGRYQDFFRALGWELDDLSAGAILLDEQENGVLVTYAFRDPANPEIWSKRSASLGTIEREEIIKAAYGRRRRLQ
jgi:hypothetical protein